MNKDRILGLAAKLESLGDKEFDMGTFMDLGDGYSVGRSRDLVGKHKVIRHICGTRGCIAGWTVAFYGDPDAYTHEAIELEAAALLGLDGKVANERLFFNTLIETKGQAAKALRALVS